MNEEKVRDWILERTTERFFAEGLSDFTMDDVAGDAGVSKKTLYRLIPSKNDLVLWVVGHQIDLIEAKQTEIIADLSLDYPGRLDAMVRVVSDLLTRIHRKSVLDMLKFSPDLWSMLRERRAKVLQGMIRIIEEGRSEGMIRSDITPEFLARFFHQMIDSLVTPQAAMEENMSPNELLDMTLGILYGGVLTRKGTSSMQKHKGER
jgi:AcrR family transcriptional regulator